MPETSHPTSLTIDDDKPADETSENKAELLKTSHCTLATITVCPTQTPSLRETNNNPQLVTTTVPCSQHTNNDNDRKMECAYITSIQAMGAVTGLLIVLLVVMTSGYIYICWTHMKKRGGLRIISKQMTR